MDTSGIPRLDKTRLDKISIDKISIDKNSIDISNSVDIDKIFGEKNV